MLVTLTEFNPWHDEKGLFSSGDAGQKAAKALIQSKQTEAEQLPVKNLDERFLDNTSPYYAGDEMKNIHDNFEEGWIEEADNLDGLAGKILAGKASPEEESDFAKQMTLNENAGPEETQMVKEYLAERYAITQKLLKDNGIEEVEVFRGIKGEQAKRLLAYKRNNEPVTIKTRSITSFSDSSDNAEEFASEKQDNKSEGAVFSIKVPREQIFSHYKASSRFVKTGEREVIVWTPNENLTIKPKQIY